MLTDAMRPLQTKTTKQCAYVGLVDINSEVYDSCTPPGVLAEQAGRGRLVSMKHFALC